ncbi:MAG TPA: hypothetical protein PKE05_04465 [Microthrixaceae bacterium]|nr:hypothetical protein [Microthrixaceae bacterium]
MKVASEPVGIDGCLSDVELIPNEDVDVDGVGVGDRFEATDELA